MTSICQIFIVFYTCKGDMIMVDFILKVLFNKEKKSLAKSCTVIREPRIIKYGGNRAVILKEYSKKQTCLSEYFINNKGLNVKERSRFNV